MANAKSVRWTITVSQETDLAVRRYLGIQGMKKGDLSRFVEEAIRRRILDRTVEGLRQDNEDLPADEIEALLKENLDAVRAGRRRSPA